MSITRCRTVIGSLYGLMRNALGLNVATPLESQELSCTVAPDRQLVVLGHEPIAGFARDHGTVADEASMLALHTLDSATLLAEPTFIAPGDSCLRADDPGWRWYCITNHGQALADWERRPLASVIQALSGAGGTAAWGGITGSIAAQIDLGSALDGKQPTLTNASTLAKIGEAGLAPTWNGGAWPGGGAGGSGYAGEYADLTTLLGAGLPTGSWATLTGLSRAYLCFGADSSQEGAWRWVSMFTPGATVSRYIRWRMDTCPGGYVGVKTLQFRMGATWYPTVPLTSNNTPTPVEVTAEDAYNAATSPVWYAFDGSASTVYWTANTSTHWIRLDLGIGQGIRPDAMRVVPQLDGFAYYASGFAVEVSSTGAFGGEQEVLYQATGVTTGWVDGVERIFTW